MPNVPINWRPLTQWPAGRARTPASDREVAKFKQPGRMEGPEGQRRYIEPKSIPLDQTLEDLDHELWHADRETLPEDVVVQVDLVDGERGLRQDGRPGARAPVNTPAVVLSFKRKRVPLVFATDHFTKWEDNLRAITKGLEALRLLERYHINQSGEQYRGWQALPSSTTTALNTEQAAAVISRFAGYRADLIIAKREHAIEAVRRAQGKAHPDAGGSTADFQLVQEAKRVLGAHHGVTL